jgi:hypothetical protein
MGIVRTKSAALAGAAAALAAAASLATAKTADAVPDPSSAGSSVGGIHLHYNDVPLGMTVTIYDDDNPDGTAEVCHYASIGADGSFPFNGNAVLNGRGPGSIFIPGQPLGKKWHVTVLCSGTGESFDFSVNY